MSEHGRLALLLPVFFCLLLQTVLVSSSPPDKVLVFKDGRRLTVRHYEEKGGLVVLTGSDGELLSVSRAMVDWKATEEINRDRSREGFSGVDSIARDEPRPGEQLTTSTRATKNGISDDATTPLEWEPPASYDGPPPPSPPEVISRDANGRVTLRAVRLAEPLVVDGRLEDPVYSEVPAASGFVQQEPLEGEPATEPTDVWFFFDDENIYVGARCWDSQPQRIVANERRRGHWHISRGANLTVVLDTFYDRRNGFFFQTNPLGGIYDALVTDESNENVDWDTVWDSQASRFEKGWTVEIVIPFKSLRYREGADQVWGINIRRVVQWKNERSFLSRIPASWGLSGIFKFSSAATLVGLEVPSGSRNFELKPYAIAASTTDKTTTPIRGNEATADAGFDVKYGLTKGLTADFTYNTDFAQVEADEEQVNLTRFSLFFPEKRSFFLENQGLFFFGGGGGPVWAPITDTPILFFSRRIGLRGGEAVPIRVGGRVTGRAGPYTLGALSIQTARSESVGAEATNFSVFRLRRDVLARSAVGVIGTYRSPTIAGAGSNQAFGVDGRFAFFQNMVIDTYYSRSRTPGRTGNEASYRFQVVNNGDRYGLEYEHLMVGDDFNPEIGFVRRRNFQRNRGKMRFSPRPASIAAVRKFSFEADLDYIENGSGSLETRAGIGSFGIEFQSGDKWNIQYTSNYEFLVAPFEIARNVILPVGGFNFGGVRTTYELGRQRRVSGKITLARGGFFSGRRTEAGYGGRIVVSSSFSVEPLVSVNWIDLPEGRFTTNLIRSRFIYTFSARMFLVALVQYNSSNDSLSSNIRFRWEYEPGSDLFVVYNDGRGTRLGGFPLLENRTLVVKLTKLFRF